MGLQKCRHALFWFCVQVPVTSWAGQKLQYQGELFKTAQQNMATLLQTRSVRRYNLLPPFLPEMWDHRAAMVNTALIEGWFESDQLNRIRIIGKHYVWEGIPSKYAYTMFWEHTTNWQKYHNKITMTRNTEIANRSTTSNFDSCVKRGGVVLSGREWNNLMLEVMNKSGDVQGWAKVRFPSSMNMRRKSCVLLPAVRQENATFFTSFSRNLGTIL